jgi:hypothetical protein
MQQHQQQKSINYAASNQQKSNKYETHFCVSKRNDCKYDNLCVNCVSDLNKNSNLRSITLNNSANGNYNQYSYNTSNSNLRANTGGVNGGAMQTRKSQDNHMETTSHQNNYDENCHFKSYYL